IAQSSALPTVADEPASPVRDVSKGEAGPTESGFIEDQDRATIAKSSTLPHDSTSRVTSPAADEGREVAAERISNDSEEIARVLTSMDAATVLAGGIDVSTGSGSIPTAGPPATDISTSSEVALTASPIRLQEQIDAQVARELEEQPEKEDIRMNEQIARDAKVARIHAEKELQAERLKKKGLNLEQEHVKKQKTSEEDLEIEKYTEEIFEEKMKKMMQLVPVEDVYVQALQVKHPIID
nr:hypothetical protein [Tanacetum cinerariifolium]